MLKRVLIISVVAALVVLAAAASPRVGLVLAGVTIAALLVRYVQRDDRPGFEGIGHPVPPAELPDTALAPDRVTDAVNQARRELGQSESSVGGDIEVKTQRGTSVVRVGYQAGLPFVVVRQPVGDETEMALVIRRHHSVLGLPRLVDNTPIETANIEYRLRSMELPGELEGAFDGATNRPRLFRELLGQGLGRQLGEAMYHPRFRLEDLVYGGDSLTIVVHPAAEPTDGPFARDCLAFAIPFGEHVRAFLETHHVSSAQS